MSQPKPELPAAAPQELIDGMCMTYRHDFGLVREEGERSLSGMTEREREALRGTMRQLWDHDIRPYVERLMASRAG
jgi:hypothetical protein